MARSGGKGKGKDEPPDVFPTTQIAQTENGETVVKRVRPLTYALMTFVKVVIDMEDTIDISDDESSAEWNVGISIDEDRELNACFTTFEDSGLITFDIYFGQFSLSPKQNQNIEHLIIETNNKFAIGHVQIVDDYIRYHASIDVRGPRIIAVAGNPEHLWSEQHGIKTRTKRNHSRTNSGRLTIGGNYSRSPLVELRLMIQNTQGHT
jgi:hypothetical protein